MANCVPTVGKTGKIKIMDSNYKASEEIKIISFGTTGQLHRLKKKNKRLSQYKTESEMHYNELSQ